MAANEALQKLQFAQRMPGVGDYGMLSHGQLAASQFSPRASNGPDYRSDARPAQIRSVMPPAPNVEIPSPRRVLEEPPPQQEQREEEQQHELPEGEGPAEEAGEGAAAGASEGGLIPEVARLASAFL